MNSDDDVGVDDGDGDGDVDGDVDGDADDDGENENEDKQDENIAMVTMDVVDEDEDDHQEMLGIGYY